MPEDVPKDDGGASRPCATLRGSIQSVRAHSSVSSTSQNHLDHLPRATVGLRDRCILGSPGLGVKADGGVLLEEWRERSFEALRRPRIVWRRRANHRAAAPAQSCRARARRSWNKALRTRTVNARSSCVTSGSTRSASAPGSAACSGSEGPCFRRSHSSSKLESTERMIARRKTSISSTVGVFAGAGTDCRGPCTCR